MTNEKIMQDLKPISEGNKKPLGERMIDHYKSFYTHDWVFSTILEKTIIIGVCVWTTFSIGRWIYGLF